MHVHVKIGGKSHRNLLSANHLQRRYTGLSNCLMFWFFDELLLWKERILVFTRRKFYLSSTIFNLFVMSILYVSLLIIKSFCICFAYFPVNSHHNNSAAMNFAYNPRWRRQFRKGLLGLEPTISASSFVRNVNTTTFRLHSLTRLASRQWNNLQLQYKSILMTKVIEPLDLLSHIHKFYLNKYIRSPHSSSKHTKVLFFSVYKCISELLRIARATLQYDHFLEKAKNLVRRMLRQGGELNRIIKLIDKINNRHYDALFSFNDPP